MCLDHSRSPQRRPRLPRAIRSLEDSSLPSLRAWHRPWLSRGLTRGRRAQPARGLPPVLCPGRDRDWAPHQARHLAQPPDQCLLPRSRRPSRPHPSRAGPSSPRARGGSPCASLCPCSGAWAASDRLGTGSSLRSDPGLCALCDPNEGPQPPHNGQVCS